jgi:hypothetical protein
MEIEIRASNPRYPGSPARMADGRLFTDYRANCNIIGGNNTFDRKEKIKHMGIDITNQDKARSVIIAGTTGCVDTMVPELTKRVCDWNGCRTLPSEAVGIGQGRLYWPGTLVEDPDVMAAHVTIPNSYPSHAGLYTPAPAAYNQGVPVVPAKPNRYSAPYYA